MLTRLKVKGFKNLLDVDLHLGPFTCIAGPNGVGKSNLFDAIHFLSRLATEPVTQAAFSLRTDGEKPFDLASLFYRYGDYQAKAIEFLAEMIIPAEGTDDLNQLAKASITYLRYNLALSYQVEGHRHFLRIDKEELSQINIGEASRLLHFKHSKSKWRDSVIHGKRNSPFISMLEDGSKIRLHQDGTAGMPRLIMADRLPRTVLSNVNASESPTAVLARREMASWRQLLLEPSAMRGSDFFTTDPGLGSDGAHLAATLDHLAQVLPFDALGRVAQRMTDLVEEFRSLKIDRDEVNKTLTVLAQDRSGCFHPARSLSDGTLRFLALTVMALDQNAGRLFCLEEPENGIHPSRIPAILQLLRDIAVDAQCAVDEDNPMRQVLINTHSPLVVKSLELDDVLFAETTAAIVENKWLKAVSFRCFPKSWWARNNLLPTLSMGDVYVYLDPIPKRAVSEKAILHLQTELPFK